MMLKHVVLLLFLYGIKNGGTSSSIPQDRTVETKDVSKNGIKKNEVGANGLEANFGANGLEANLEKITRNFQNPVIEYLIKKNPDRSSPPQGGVVREIQHSQTLLVPSFLGRPSPEFFIGRLPHSVSQKKSPEESTRNPGHPPFDNFWNLLKNKTQAGGSKIQESVVSSPVLHLNKNPGEIKEESTKIQVYPAAAVVVNTFNRDGSLKTSVTHFLPDYDFLRPEANENKEATHKAGGKNESESNKNLYNNQYVNGNFGENSQIPFSGGNGYPQGSRQGISWPFANYFPVVIHDPFLSVYNAFATSMYNAVSTMVEYGPEADICSKKKNHESRDQISHNDSNEKKAFGFANEKKKTDENVFDEVTMRSDSIKKSPSISEFEDSQKMDSFNRKLRDTTAVFVKSREGDTVDITIEEPSGSEEVDVNSPDERARSFSQVLVNTPPLSTLLRPPQQGYSDKKRKTKPSKPIKEEGTNEEVGEEHEEESTNQSQESANEAVAISPPPEGASVAEAKPIGLAIAGPGGVAASKPQGTAVAGPGGLAIARPVGTAIAGVDVEGSVPIGGQQKNKKKPKQEKEQMETELHYVGGLTGPIGNPKPKEFADRVYYKTVKETEGNNIQDNLFFRGRPNADGFQLKLGQQNGKYGFIPMFASPVTGEGRLQKRTDFPIFFHGLLGNNAQKFDQFQNYQTPF